MAGYTNAETGSSLPAMISVANRVMASRIGMGTSRDLMRVRDVLMFGVMGSESLSPV